MAVQSSLFLQPQMIEHFWRVYKKPHIIKMMGPVYCLPGMIPEIEKKQKKTDFSIPSRKAILLSPMCFMQFVHNSADIDSKNMCKYIVKQRMNAIGDIQLNVDGKSVKDRLVRQATSLFSLDYVFTAASDGYWLLLQPGELEKGIHNIDTYGTCSSGATKIPLHFKVSIK